MESTIIDLGTRINQLGSQVEAMTTSRMELVRAMAEMIVQANRGCSIGQRLNRFGVISGMSRGMGNGRGEG